MEDSEFVTTGDLGGTRLRFDEGSYLQEHCEAINPRRSSGYVSAQRRDGVPCERADVFPGSPISASFNPEQDGERFIPVQQWISTGQMRNSTGLNRPYSTGPLYPLSDPPMRRLDPDQIQDRPSFVDRALTPDTTCSVSPSSRVLRPSRAIKELEFDDERIMEQSADETEQETEVGITLKDRVTGKHLSCKTFTDLENARAYERGWRDSQARGSKQADQDVDRDRGGIMDIGETKIKDTRQLEVAVVESQTRRGEPSSEAVVDDLDWKRPPPFSSGLDRKGGTLNRPCIVPTWPSAGPFRTCIGPWS
jgi:hypothetical protein